MEENYPNNLQDERLENIEKHIGTLNKEMGSVKTDIKWIKKFIFTLLPIGAGTIITLIYIALKIK